jgi:hypothetical protein
VAEAKLLETVVRMKYQTVLDDYWLATEESKNLSIVQLRSNELLVNCLDGVLHRESYCSTHPLLVKEYGLPIQYADLKYAVLSIAKCLKGWQKTEELTLFSLQPAEMRATLDFGNERFGRVNEVIQNRWLREKLSSAQRLANHAKEVLVKKICSRSHPAKNRRARIQST